MNISFTKCIFFYWLFCAVIVFIREFLLIYKRKVSIKNNIGFILFATLLGFMVIICYAMENKQNENDRT